jgi:hypothetical protein
VSSRLDIILCSRHKCHNVSKNMSVRSMDKWESLWNEENKTTIEERGKKGKCNG